MTNSKTYKPGVSLGYTPTQICEFYDRHPDLTLAELAEITGRTVSQLKRILLGASK